MRILYVTTLWSGLKYLLDGEEAEKGMPAFVRPLKRLCEDDHKVDMILVAPIKREDVSEAKGWFSDVNLLEIINSSGIISNCFRLYNVMARLLKKERYDFIYGHGPYGGIANLCANRFKVPFGQRLYGVFLWDMMKKRGSFIAKLRSILEYSCFVFSKRFLLITDDGSGGDKVHQSIRFFNPEKHYTFYHWLNGVEKEMQRLPSLPKEAKLPYLFYAARLDSWKRQDVGISILRRLVEKNLPFSIYLAGHESDKAYCQKLREQVRDAGLENSVFFLGQIDGEAMLSYVKNALANLFFYDISNKGNVFYETFSTGGVIVAKNDHSLDAFIRNGENGFLVDNAEAAAEIIEKLYQDPALWRQISQAAERDADVLVRSWEDRIDDEIRLIKEAAGK